MTVTRGRTCASRWRSDARSRACHVADVEVDESLIWKMFVVVDSGLTIKEMTSSNTLSWPDAASVDAVLPAMR